MDCPPPVTMIVQVIEQGEIVGLDHQTVAFKCNNTTLTALIRKDEIKAKRLLLELRSTDDKEGR